MSAQGDHPAMPLRTVGEESITQGEDLPEQDPEGPNVTQGGVEAVEDALGGHPLQGQEGLWEAKDGLSARRGGAPPCTWVGEEAWQFPSPALPHSLVPEGLSLLAHNSYTNPGTGQRIRRPNVLSHKLGT